MDNTLIVSASPHIRSESVSRIMLDVIPALIPAAICGDHFWVEGIISHCSFRLGRGNH